MAALSFLETTLRTVVFVDGYNLYYGLLRRSKFKWLDLFKLFNEHVLTSDANLIQIRYYTSPVLGRMCDSVESPARQRRYIQALSSSHAGLITIVQGKIVVSRPYLRLVSRLPEAPEVDKVQVFNFNEKKTDVNIAVDMLNGAWLGQFDQAVLCSNDSDLEAALALIRQHIPKIRLGLVAPIYKEDSRHMSHDLIRHVHWSKVLSVEHIKLSQFPDQIPGTSLRKPDIW